MVLGDFRKVSGPFGPQLICAPSEEKSLAEGLSEALVNIRDEEPLLLDEIEEPIEDARISIPADPDVANFSYAVVDDKIYFRENDEMFRVELGKTPAARVRGMVELRDTVRELINAQVNDLPDRVIDQLQAQLNDQYNAFTKKFGIINSRGNALAFSDDSSYYLLCSLEQLDKHGNFSGKADIFTKRTISPPRPIHHTDTAYEALVVSIGERGRVDLDLMSRLCGKETKELLQDLEGRIFQDPAHPGSYQLAATYLSGNIREKLREAQVADEKSPGQFTANIQALKDAVPPELGPGEIILKLGATWVPPDVYRDFIYETFKPYAPWQEANLIDVGYSEVLNLWNISGKSLDRNSVAATSTYGTKRMDAYTILENTLNLRDIRIFDVVEVDGVERRVVNAEETILAQEKQQQIREAFGAWVWSDPQRTERLCKIYNEKFNCFKPPEYDGDILTFHGMNSEKQLRKNQKDTIARILFSGNTQVAHAVGAGKTWTMVGAAMEGKYLGLCNKTMIVVPNHLVGQWASDIYDLYPAAKVLAVTKKDFETKNRKKFCGRIATGDYDIIVLGHSQLERIPLSTERQKQFVQDQIDEVMDGIYELEASGEKHFSIKQLERKKKTLERKMEKLTNSKQRDDVISFEELGVDRLFVDESDEFKNLYYTTKMQNVAGLSQADSQKASDLYMKCRYIDELTDNKGNVHATGTPLSNTMAEIYNMQRFLQYDLLKELGLHHFDSWASSFAEVNPVLELAPEGSGYIVRNRLTNFNNLPELLSLYRLVADVQTHETLNLPLPNVHYITRALPPSDAQKKMVQSLAERAEKIRKGSIRPEDDNMLCVVNDGRKLALDQRLMDPTLPDDPDSKVNACAQDVYNQWFEGRTDRLTQLVFCDISTPKPNTFNVYETLRDKLVEKGIPREEICFIHEANTDAKKEELFARVRDGSVRVLMGSTGKMGTGTNVQDLLVAGHDLDVPWRPRDLTQRDGRVIRQGNENDDVYIYRYVTEGTFDAYMYQLLENKQRLIHQIFTSKSPARQMEDIDQMAISFAEIKAIASGNTLVKEKVELQMAISKLELLKARHTNNQASLAKQVKSELPDKIKDTKERISRLTSDVKHLNEINAESSANGRSPIEIEGTTFEKPGEAGEAVLSAIDKLPLNDTHEIGCYRGFKVSAGREEAQSGEMQRTIYLHGTNEYPIPLSDKSAGVMQRLDHFLDKSLPQRLADNQASLEHLERRLAEAKQEIGKPFLYENDLREKVTRMAQLDEQLNLDANKNNLSNEMPKEDLETPSQTNVQPISFEDRIQSAVKRASDQLASLQTKQYEIRH